MRQKNDFFIGTSIFNGTRRFKLLAVFAAIAFLALIFAGCNNNPDEQLTASTENEGTGNSGKSKAEAPVASPSPELAVAAGTEVYLTSGTAGALIYYTTDGSTPTEESTPYSDPVIINSPTIIKAVAVKEGIENSAVTTLNYTIGEGLFTGTAYVGHTLTASPGAQSYQWDVGGTISNTASYTVTAADFRKPITLKIYNGGTSQSVTITPSVRGVPLAELADYLGSVSAGSADSPNIVPLNKMNISGANWDDINNIVRRAEKYVSLNLADCTAAGNSIAGAFPGVANPVDETGEPYTTGNFNIIKDNGYIAGIALPDALTSIGFCAFLNCANLKSVYIPSGVTSIGTWAFFGCAGLTSITIPARVSSMGDESFKGCDSLASVTLEEGVTCIGAYAFDSCVNLTKVTIPSTVTSIGDGAFTHCKSLTNITIPDSVTSLGSTVFSSCTSLGSIIIPAGVPSIGYDAFANCTSLNTVKISEGVKSIGGYAFSNCTSLWYIEIPEGITSIGFRAFLDCDKISTVHIPASVTSISEYAFENCPNLLSVIFYPGSNIESGNFGTGAFPLTEVNGGNNLRTVYLAASTKAGQYERSPGKSDWVWRPLED